MKLKYLKAAFTGLIFTVSSIANAEIIERIDFDAGAYEVTFSGLDDGTTIVGDGNLVISGGVALIDGPPPLEIFFHQRIMMVVIHQLLDLILFQQFQHLV